MVQQKKSVPKRQTGIKEGVISYLGWSEGRAGKAKSQGGHTVMQIIPNRNYFLK